MRWLALLVVLAAVAWLLLGHGLGLAEVAAWRGWAAAHPLLAPLGFTLLYAALTAVAMPGATVLTLAGGLLFGTALGSLCTATGATAGAVVLFLMARRALGRALAGRAGRLLDRVRPGLERDGLSCLLALRLLPVVPFWLINLGAGMVRMRTGVFVLGTAVGIIPATVIYSATGAGLAGVLAAGGRPDLGAVLRPGVVLPLVALSALALLPVALRRWRTGGRPRPGARVPAPPPTP